MGVIKAGDLKGLKISQLRDILINTLDMSNTDAKNIKGKVNIMNHIVETLGLMTPQDIVCEETEKIEEENEQIAMLESLEVEDDLLDMRKFPKDIEKDNKQAMVKSCSRDLTPADYGWTEYVLAELKDDEKIKDKNNPKKEYPTTDGLRRLVEKFVGTIVTSKTDVCQTPSPANERRATVTVTVEILSDNLNIGIMSFMGASDVYAGNSVSPFSFRPVAVSETKSEGRAYKKALKIKVSTYEEMADTTQAGQDFDNTADDISVSLPQFIKTDQINFIDMLCRRLDVNVEKLIAEFLPNLKEKYDRIPYDEACNLLAEIQTYQGNEKSIKQEIKGYTATWDN